VSDRYGLKRGFGGPVARRESAYRPGGDGGHPTPGHGEADGRSDLTKIHATVRRRRIRISRNLRSEATPNALGIALNGMDRGRRPGAYREFFTPNSERRLAEGKVRPAASGSPRPPATGAGSRFGGGLLLWLGLAILLSGPPGGPGGLGPFHV
jgi:hypothetical protein